MRQRENESSGSRGPETLRGPPRGRQQRCGLPRSRLSERRDDEGKRPGEGFGPSGPKVWPPLVGLTSIRRSNCAALPVRYLAAVQRPISSQRQTPRTDSRNGSENLWEWEPAAICSFATGFPYRFRHFEAREVAQVGCEGQVREVGTVCGQSAVEDFFSL